MDGALKLFNKGIALYERLVSGGCISLTEQYAMSTLGRALCLVELGRESKASEDARHGIALLQGEIQRTGRADLIHVVTVMRQALGYLLK